MEGQSGDCPFVLATCLLFQHLSAAMEGQSGDCPFCRKHDQTTKRYRAAMEGQSGDCPFGSLKNIVLTWDFVNVSERWRLSVICRR